MSVGEVKSESYQAPGLIFFLLPPLPHLLSLYDPATFTDSCKYQAVVQTQFIEYAALSSRNVLSLLSNECLLPSEVNTILNEAFLIPMRFFKLLLHIHKHFSLDLVVHSDFEMERREN